MTPLRRTLAGFIRDRYRAAGSSQSHLRAAICNLSQVVTPDAWSVEECLEFASLAGFPTCNTLCWSVDMYRSAVRNVINRAK